MSYADVILASNPVAWWRLNETSGIVATDSSNNGRNGTYVPNSGGAWTGGNQAQPGVTIDGDLSAQFDGSDTASVNCGQAISGVNTITLECWAKCAAIASGQSNEMMIAKHPGEFYFALRPNSSNTVRFVTIDNLGARHDYDLTIVPDSEWHYWVATWDGTTKRIYRDAVQLGSFTWAKTALAAVPTIPVLIGNFSSTGWGFNGWIDEAAVYNYALTPEQITAHYTSATTPEETNRRLFGSRLFGSKLFGGTL